MLKRPGFCAGSIEEKADKTRTAADADLVFVRLTPPNIIPTK
jgi:hypothetical protein